MQDAKEHLQAGLQRAPQHPHMLLLAARVARRLGEYDQADSFLAQAEATGAVERTLLSLENILAQVQRHGIRLEMERHLFDLAEQHPAERPLILEAMAVGYLHDKYYIAAHESLDASLNDIPANVVALRGRGIIRMQVTRYKEAVADFQLASELEPKHELGRFLLARSLIKSGREREALPHLEQLERTNPSEVDVLVGIASCRAAAGQLETALELLTKALAAQPRHVDGLLERGRIALEMNQPADAESWLRQCVAVDPRDRRAHYLLYQSLRLQHKHEEAKEQLTRSNQVLADLVRSSEIMFDDMKKRPNDPDLLCELGVLALRNGEERLGQLWLERALVLNPAHSAAQQALADHHKKTRQRAGVATPVSQAP